SEVAALRRVGNHGNITQLLSYDQHYLTLTLRHEQGQSLDKFLDSSQRCTIPPSSAILVWKQVTSAVSHLHSLNLVHDDIKPDNIVWSPEDHHAVLIDFGAALDLDVLPKDYFNPSGTPSYAPPEFLLKRKGPEADVWELGIV
ncbi:kinase-like domain-containing protein, partial [Fimicolochytrium jonesii]|uniref:kinase-like domain-containing protein n=1 Tax=Fimicolochytrium jonesii TaxID=1396493 RepID=UPI0022FF4395